MNEIIWPFILASIAGFSTLIGCLSIFLPIKKHEEFITFCISLSLSVMLMISLFDLIPTSLKNMQLSSFADTFLTFIIFFGIGMLMVYLFNYIIEKGKGSNSSLYKLGILNFLALILHNLPEGILTFMSTYQDFELGLSLCFAITLHNIPEGVSIAVPIYYSTGSRWRAIKSTLLSGLAEPIGALLAFLILKNYVTEQMISVFLILIAGIMITLSINKMLPEALEYKKTKPMYFGLIIGIVVVIFSLIF